MYWNSLNEQLKRQGQRLKKRKDHPLGLRGRQRRVREDQGLLGVASRISGDPGPVLIVKEREKSLSLQNLFNPSCLSTPFLALSDFLMVESGSKSTWNFHSSFSPNDHLLSHSAHHPHVLKTHFPNLFQPTEKFLQKKLVTKNNRHDSTKKNKPSAAAYAWSTSRCGK